MRIITGSAKGTRLFTPEGADTTRPTPERAKEAMFSMLQFDIEGRAVLDLFSGTGQLGLEALSRGAARAMFVDSDANAIALVKKNAMKTKLFDKSSFLISDYRSYLRKAAGKDAFDIVIIDPPYTSNAIADVLKRLYEGKLLRPGALVVCESDNEEDQLSAPGATEHYKILKSNGYGKVRLTLLTPEKEENSGTDLQG